MHKEYFQEGNMEEHKEAQTAFSFPDDPLARHEELKADREFGSEGQSLTDLRLAALSHARAMPASGDGKWVQLGPMAIPKAGTYSADGTRVLVTGRITSIVADPTDSNTLYVGTAQGGIWKTIDRGKTWSPISDNTVSLAIGALAIGPGHPLTLYAGTGEGNFSADSYYGCGVLKTTDGGNLWTRLGSETFTRMRFCRLVIDPTTPTTLFAATVKFGEEPSSEGGLYRSVDGGTSWSPMTNGLPSLSPGATDVMIDPKSPKTVYAAFWGKGIYRTDDAGAANPTWTQLTGGLQASGFSRISLGMALSDPQTLYALLADNVTTYINEFYRSTDGGKTWHSIPLPGAPDGSSLPWKNGFYNLNVAVDPTTPDVVYLSTVTLWKAIYHPATGAWTFTNIGSDIHPDHHALAFDPVDSLQIYAGTDGGIYVSSDGGITWSDTLNTGLCITQCEFMEQHPTSDAVIFIGTQDNGIEQYRNSQVFYHADDGDAGFVAIDPANPRTILGTYYGLTPKRSLSGGEFGTWASLWNGLSGSSLFYPPLTLDQSNPKNSAIGGTKVFLDAEQGMRGWPFSVELPGLTEKEFVSALNYTNSDLIYVGTNKGKVYRLKRSESGWTSIAIHNAPLPVRFIWDIAPRPDDINTVIVVMSGFGTAHVWRGTVPDNGAAVWTDISGPKSGPEHGGLPDIPVNALTIDTPDVMYIATDTGVFRTTDGGTTWTDSSDGLPNCAVFDMRLHQPTRLLRVATHGRGVWELRLGASTPGVDTFMRDNLMQTGRRPSSSAESAAFEDPLQHVALGNPVWWWQCADIKIDALEVSIPEHRLLADFQMKVDEVDYVAFESRLEHRNPLPGRVNRVYVQIHNRGTRAVHSVTVKVFYMDATAGLPDLPPDFWTAFPADSTHPTTWKPIGTAQTIQSLSPTEPTVLEWGCITTAEHSCFLVVMDCPSDPIPEAQKVLQVGTLVASEKHVGLKNVHVVNITSSPPGTIYPDIIYWTPFRFFGKPELHHSITLSQSWGNGATGQHTRQSWNLALIFPKEMPGDLKLEGIVRATPTAKELKALTSKFGGQIEQYYDTTALYTVENLTVGARVAGVSLPSNGLQVMVMFAPRSEDTADANISIVQETEGIVVGGSTFVLRLI
jgi:photosystem II stability/assembly factor-like uncharacterized protein